MNLEKKLGLLAFVPKSIFQNINYICLFTEKQLIVIEDDNIENYIEETEVKLSFFERVREAFNENKVTYNLSKEKMLQNKSVKEYMRGNTSDVYFSTLNNQLNFYSKEENKKIVLNFDYDTEEIIIFVRKIFGISDNNIE